MNFGTYSAGSAPHMTINELNKQYGLTIEPIHYRGEAPMWTGLAEGTLDVAMGSYTAAQTVLQSGRGVVFGVHSKKVDAIPEIRTLPEQGATSKFFTVSGSRAGHCRRRRRSRSSIGCRRFASPPITIRR
ncbi:tripartite-type tricarboxylate transporter receptor subunit TctC [Bradyrhizobium sp. USDA 4509]